MSYGQTTFKVSSRKLARTAICRSQRFLFCITITGKAHRDEEMTPSIHNPNATFSSIGRCGSQGRFSACLAAIVTIFALSTTGAVADQGRPAVALEMTRADRTAADALAKRLAALSSTVNREEANRLAQSAYAMAGQLKRDYGVIWPPLFNNFLIHSGIRKRGFCFEWAEDLLLTLDQLKLASLELHWGEGFAGTWQESNCVVVTAKGRPFNSGIILDGWRHSGHLYWTAVATDKVPWVENRSYARLVRARSEATANHDFASQARGRAKPGRSD